MQRSAHNIVIIVRPVNSNVAASAELACRRNFNGRGLGRVIIRRGCVTGDKKCQIKKIPTIEWQVGESALIDYAGNLHDTHYRQAILTGSWIVVVAIEQQRFHRRSDLVF